MYVFRNNTIERFFPRDYSFSGYGNISDIPDAESYLWFYQAPLGFDQEAVAKEIGSYSQQLNIVLSHISSSKMLIALTMVEMYGISPTENDTRVREAITAYNDGLYSAAEHFPNVKVIDLSDFTKNYDDSELIDWKYYFISQMGLNPKLAKPFCQWFDKKLEQIERKRKKCLVLDLDNTLWGGVLGEDGIEGIKIGGDYPGKAFLYFQQALHELSSNGVILAVCSKNNEEDVLAAWSKNPFMLLKQDDFVAWRINWEDKASNLQSLAEELNIGLDSIVFIDDNPSERELIRKVLPSVIVPDFPEHPYDLPVFYKHLLDNYFKVYSVTAEDRAKTEQYKANARRAESQKHFTDIEEFLKSLELHLTITRSNEFNIPRISQLTQKTNQFNLTTMRYTDTDIKQMEKQGNRIWCVSVADRFGDSGITGCIIINGNRIDSFLLSCRVLGKGVEDAFIKSVLRILREDGAKNIDASYIPSPKNNQVKDYYERCGFSCYEIEPNGTKHYNMDLRTADLSIKDYIKITVL